VRTNTWVARGESLPFMSLPLGGSVILPPNLEGLESFNLALPPGVTALLPSRPTNLIATTVSSTRIDLTWVDTATNELGFRVEQSFDGITFASVAVVAADMTNHSWIDLKPGIRHHYRLRALNGIGESSYSNTNSASTRTPFEHWQITQFTPAQLTNAALAGPDADPDADGLRNFVEYAFNRAPFSADADRPGEAAIDRLTGAVDVLSLVYTRNKAAIDATVSAEVSSNLVSWPSGSNQATGPLTIAQSDETVTEKFQDTIPIGAHLRRFLRLLVTNTGVRDSWLTNSSMPIALDEVACGVLEGRLYVVGGGNAATLAFDIATARWTNLNAARPFAGNHHAAEVFNGKLYLLGGFGADSGGRVQIYDPATNGWSLGAPMPFGAGSCASAVINGEIYVAGGLIGSSITNGLARYQPASNTWTLLAPMPLARHHTASATDGRRFYVFGGRSGGGLDGWNTVQIYHPTNNTWMSSTNPDLTLAPLPQARGGMGKAVFFNVSSL
jgi:hypothetical protein